MKLSTIVPIYNVEKFLPRCLDSLLRQGMDPNDWEVICVNDGSTDSSPSILAEYETKHPNIFKIVTQENQGLGGARNTGLKVAKGEWVTFVDSDDYLADRGYAYLCNHFLRKEVDVLTFLSRRVYHFELSQCKQVSLNGVITFEGDGAEAYSRLKYKSVWSKFYKRLFLLEHNIWFEKILSQDQIFNFLVFSHSPHVVMTNCEVYRYMQDNTESIQQTTDPVKVRQLMTDQLYGMGVLNDFLHKGRSSMDRGVRKTICDYLGIFYTKSFYAFLSVKEWDQYMHPIRRMGINKFLRENEKTFLGNMIVLLKCASSHSYLMYLIVAYIHRNVFEKYIRKRILK